MVEPFPRQIDTVRREVRNLLTTSQAFQTLAPPQQRELANAMVRVGSFLADDPGWLAGESPARARALAGSELARGLGEGLASQGGPNDSDPVDDLKRRLAEKPGQVGGEFTAGAVREGVEQFGQMVQKVDFPAFVSGLVQGVFKSVVDSSIEQMKAYTEMLGAVVKSVDQFANDHIQDGEARDFIATRYPGAVQVDTSGPTARLRARADADDTTAPGRDLLGKDVDLDEDEGERALVAAAKVELARQRQQMLATMVLLGIHRIVITNGRINAKVVFDMRADDSASRKSKASLHDEKKSSSRTSAAAAVWSPWGAAGASTEHRNSHVATVGSAVDDTSSSRASVKAQLSGDVRLSFKSETFPLEKMLDTGGMALLNSRAAPVPTPGSSPTPTAPMPPAPAGPPAPAR